MQLETLLRLLDNDQLNVDDTLNETRDLLDDYMDRNQVPVSLPGHRLLMTTACLFGWNASYVSVWSSSRGTQGCKHCCRSGIPNSADFHIGRGL